MLNAGRVQPDGGRVLGFDGTAGRGRQQAGAYTWLFRCRAVVARRVLTGNGRPPRLVSQTIWTLFLTTSPLPAGAKYWVWPSLIPKKC
jgi:hypothetical protein